MRTISSDYFKKVYNDGIDCANNPKHPCHHFVQWQNDAGITPFQLPEPLSGASCSLGIAFMGLNPSISANEIIPTSRWSFDEFMDYYRTRFSDNNRDEKGKLTVKDYSGQFRRVKLWNTIEKFGRDYISSDFCLGVDALLIEDIRYKSTKGWLGYNEAQEAMVQEHQFEFTEALLDEKVFNVVVVMGNKALNQIRKFAVDADKIPHRIGLAMGRSYECQTKAGTKFYACPIKHLSYPTSKEMMKRVADQIIECTKLA